MYRICCGECQATYIGETGQKLLTQFKEYINKAYGKVQPHKSAFASHLLESAHLLEHVNVSLLHKGQVYNRWLGLEAIKITRHSKIPVSYTHLTLPTIYSV